MSFPDSFYDKRTNYELALLNPTRIMHAPEYTINDAMQHPNMTFPFTYKWDTITATGQSAPYNWNSTIRFEFPNDHHVIEDCILEMGLYQTTGAGTAAALTPKAGMRAIEYAHLCFGNSKFPIERLEGDHMSLFEEIEHISEQRTEEELRMYNFDVASLNTYFAGGTANAPCTYKYRLPFHCFKDKKMALKTAMLNRKAYIDLKFVASDDYIHEDAQASHNAAAAGAAWLAATETTGIQVCRLHVKYVDYADEAEPLLNMEYIVPFKHWGEGETFNSWTATDATSPEFIIKTRGLAYGFLVVVRHSENLPESHDTTNGGGATAERHSPWIMQRLDTIRVRYDTHRVWDDHTGDDLLAHILKGQLSMTGHSVPVQYGVIGPAGAYTGKQITDNHALADQDVFAHQSGTKFIYWIPSFSEKPFHVDAFLGGFDVRKIQNTELQLSVPNAFTAGTFKVYVWPLMLDFLKVGKDKLELYEPPNM